MDPDFLERIAQATSLREGAAGVAAFVRTVHRQEGIRLADAARATRLPLPVATAIRRELEKSGILQRLNGLVLSEDGKKLAKDVLGLHPPLEFDISPVPLSSVAPPLDRVVEVLERHLAAAPRTDVALDQAPSTAETAVRRAALLYRSGALEGQRVAIIGDDDSVSLAIGLIGTLLAGQALPRRLSVIELDPERIEFLRRAAETEGIPLEIVPHDLRDPLPPALVGAFDVFETDPPYTLAGAELFLRRGVEALDHARGQGMLSYGHTAPRERLRLQEKLVALGLATTALHPGFNRYGGATILGSTSELYELVSVGVAMPAERWEGPLYTAEFNPRERVYACTNCKRRWQLGENGIPATITALKESGCPACGNKDFTRART